MKNMLVEKAIIGSVRKSVPSHGFPIHYTGHLHDDLSLRALYSAADVMVIPSRQDILPNTGVEAHACGTPVVAFDIGGLPDIVKHQKTGYLAEAFDTEDLAQGILWVLAQAGSPRACGPGDDDLRAAARSRAVQRFTPLIISTAYESVYEKCIG